MRSLVTAEPTPEDILFNRTLDCFSEATDQDCKLYSQYLHRGENFGLLLHLEPKSHFSLLSTHETKEPRHNWNLNFFGSHGFAVHDDLMLTLLYHKWPSSKVLQLIKTFHQQFHVHVFPSHLKIFHLIPASETDLRIRSSIFSVDTFFINILYLTPKPNILSFDLSKL